MKSLWCILLVNLVLIVPYALTDTQEGTEDEEYYNEKDDAAVPDELTAVYQAQLEIDSERLGRVEQSKHSTHRSKHKKSKHVKTTTTLKLSTTTPTTTTTTSVLVENKKYPKINITAMFANMIYRTRKPQLPQYFDWADHYTLYGKKRNRYGEPESYAEVVRAQKLKTPGGLGFAKLREDYKSKKEQEPISKRKEMIRYALDVKSKKKSYNEDIVAKYLKSKNPFEGIPKHVFDADMYKYRGLR